MVDDTSTTLDDFYMTAAEVAARLRLSPETLANLRTRGEGIPWRKVSGKVLYRASDVLAAEAAGHGGFTWARLEVAIRSYPKLGDTAAEGLIAHVRKVLR